MEVGKRSVIQTVEYLATHSPDKAWTLRPRDEQDISKGFEEISYGMLGNAVNHAAHWLKQSLGDDINVVAYQGLNDLRIPILCLGAAKAGKRVLLPSRTNNRKAQHHLLSATKCSAFIHGHSVVPDADLAELKIQDVVAPELDEWLTSAVAPAIAFEKSWEEHRYEPWIILHTSGTTGLPKILPYTHQMMASFDAFKLAAESENENLSSEASHGRWYTGIPMFHFVGLVVVLQFPIFLGSVAVVGPCTTPPTTTTQITEIFKQASLHGGVLAPFDIEKLASTPEGWQELIKLRVVSFAGAQLRQSLGDKLHQQGVLVNASMGTTEMGGYVQKLRRDDDWQYLTLSPCMGATFERYPGDEGLYELVFVKTPGLERYQQVFDFFPDRTTYPTSDLFYKHPSLPDAWRYAGRSDDYVKLSTGYGILASRVEDMIMEKSRDFVDAVIMGGTSHTHPCAIVFPKKELADDEVASFMESLWPHVEVANASSGDMAQIPKHLILVGDPARPWVRTSKGTISRRQTLAQYQDDLEALYSRGG